MSDRKLLPEGTQVLADSVSLHARAANRVFFLMVSLTILVSFGHVDKEVISLFGLKVQEPLVRKYVVFIVMIVNVNYAMNRVLMIDAADAYFAFIRANSPSEVLFRHPSNNKSFTRADVMHRLHASSIDRVYPVFSVLSSKHKNMMTAILRPAIEIVLVSVPYVALLQLVQIELFGSNIYTLVFALVFTATVVASIMMLLRGLGWTLEARDRPNT